MIKDYFVRLGLAALVLGFLSCDSEDREILPGTDEPAAVDAQINGLEIRSGRNRVQVKGAVPQGVNVSEVMIYWDDRANSVSVPVNNQDTIATVIDGLPEGMINFEVVTLNAQQTLSRSRSGAAVVYGSNYQNALYNRPVELNKLIESTLEIQYQPMDLSTGAIGTEITYEDTSGDTKTTFLDIDEERIAFDDFASGTSYTYRTVFVPTTQAIDTFYTESATVRPIPVPILKNAGIPYAQQAQQGRWGILADWVTTEPVLIHDGMGGWDEWNTGIFNIESGWGAPAITNGKIYQSVEAGAADFTLRVTVRDTNHEVTDEGGSYFVVAMGEGLPDVADVTTAPEVIGYQRIDVNLPLEYNIDFTVPEEGIITVGQITTQWGETPGRFCNIFTWEILPR